jgi:hypothetical protein
LSSTTEKTKKATLKRICEHMLLIPTQKRLFLFVPYFRLQISMHIFQSERGEDIEQRMVKVSHPFFSKWTSSSFLLIPTNSI